MLEKSVLLPDSCIFIMVDDYLSYGKLLKYYHKKVCSFLIVRAKKYSIIYVDKSFKGFDHGDFEDGASLILINS